MIAVSLRDAEPVRRRLKSLEYQIKPRDLWISMVISN